MKTLIYGGRVIDPANSLDGLYNILLEKGKVTWIGKDMPEAERCINAAIDAITASLVKGEKVQISGFGTFEIKDREARVGRNPHTKESIEIPATRVPGFKASKALKDTVAK